MFLAVLGVCQLKNADVQLLPTLRRLGVARLGDRSNRCLHRARNAVQGHQPAVSAPDKYGEQAVASPRPAIIVHVAC